jgi:hypothetical protein
VVGVCLKIVIDVISIDKIYVEVLCTDNVLCYEGVTFEEAEKWSGMMQALFWRRR